ncbi:MAG: hypothetical protein M0Q91_04165 [Methanoregula sp.]|jgi:hypothetical protein|nr:hypothetical protein [Methanoregula sp.]
MITTIYRNLLIGGLLIVVGVLLILVRDWMPQNIILISSSLIAAGILFVAISALQLKGTSEKPVVIDERILKIRAHTFMKAYLFSFTIVCILGLLDFSGLLVITSRSVIMIIVFTMGLSASLLSWYYNRQGDICEG